MKLNVVPVNKEILLSSMLSFSIHHRVRCNSKNLIHSIHFNLGIGSQRTSSTRANEKTKKSLLGWGFSIGFAVGATAYASNSDYDNDSGVFYESNVHLSNWSGTFSSTADRLYEPKSLQELSRLVNFCNKEKRKIRPIGTCLSPNGIGFPRIGDSVVSLVNIDHIEVKPELMQVTVGAGIRVGKVLDELKRHKMTLQNFSSIQEQQIGGWTQVAAHGTGRSLSTIEEQITELQIVTPGVGILNLSSDKYPNLFSIAKVGLGSLGIISEVTLKCIPQLELKEENFKCHRDEIQNGHMERLQQYRHVRYMWFPYSQHMIASISNPYNNNNDYSININTPSFSKESDIPITPVPIKTAIHKLAEEKLKDVVSVDFISRQDIPQLRDMLLDLDPLNTDYVKRINIAESESWVPTSNTITRVGDSTDILGFDCGGQQLVFEVCFSCGYDKGVCYDSAATNGTASATTNGDNAAITNSNAVAGRSKDIEFVHRLLRIIEEAKLPAPSPIEQRWTASSSSLMSPAYSENPNEVFSWVGIIMYLPPNQNDLQRQEIKKKFLHYRKLIQPLLKEFGAVIHWGKIYLPEKDLDSNVDVDVDVEKDLEVLRENIRSRYNVDKFNEVRKLLDPNSILSNELIDELFNEK